MPRGTKGSRPKQTKPSSTLETYVEKRDFARTPEPAPDTPSSAEGPLTFVIQKHAARRLHYDFRLELDGVLKSWSVPKGPSLNPQEKRLAVMVEDHPLDYGSFEGVIPKKEYGAGQVIVWDNGTYTPDEGGPLSFHDRNEAEERMRQGIEDGKISILMRGKKMKGSWALVKIQRAENEWLLIKHKDATADPASDILDEDRSVSSDLSIDDLKSGHLPDRAHRGPAAITPRDAPGTKRQPCPSAVEPMLATPAEEAFSNAGWVFEPKFDGVRAIAIVRNGDVKLLTRSGLDATAQYPSLAQELARQPAHEAVFDGEIVALDEDGRPSFEVLQQRLNLTRPADIKRHETETPVFYYAFDLLYLDGFDLRGTPLTHRRALLERALSPSNHVQLLDQFDEAGVAAYDAALAHGIEGIVAKRKDSIYESGRRSRSWLKIKGTMSDEFVVGGYSEGQGGRADSFGALLIGQYDDDGRLVYVSNVGSGFDDRTLGELRERLDALRADDCPFVEVPDPRTPSTWVRPELVVEVKFSQWTRDGHIRAPVFLRLRQDTPANDVQRVEVMTAPSTKDAAHDEDASLDDDIAEVLEQLDAKKEKLSLQVQDQKIALTNLDKPLWPKHGRQRALTKRDFIEYLTRVSPYLLPHLHDRPLTLTRYPNGIEGGHFYQKHWEGELPEFVDTVGLFSSSNEGDQEYLICNNLPTLLWLGQLADLELHTWYSRVSAEPDGAHLTTTFTGSKENIEGSLLNYPDFIVFDLDPYIYSGKESAGDEPELNKKAFAKTCEVALWLKEILDSLSLSSFVKTTGRTGLHIYVPVLRQLDYTAVRAACETIGHFLLQRHPRDVTMEWSVDKRAGKVFFDHNQNMRGKTLASLYSPRPLPEAAVSTPVRWNELGDIYPTDFTILTVPERLAQVGDLWANILDAKHDIEGLLGGAEAE
ncbi:MAG: DNA ligase D [Dehalococcoidia bacterium]